MMYYKIQFICVSFALLFTQLIESKSVAIGEAAAYNISERKTNGEIKNRKAGYYTVEEETYTVGLIANVGFGAYEASGKNSDGEETYHVEVLTTGVEVGSGLMGRVGVVDATVKAGPVGINMGVTADTGILVKDGLEAKLLGIGGSITKSGIQICFFACFGISW